MNNLQLSQQEAAKELLARRKARSSLLDFTEYTKPDFKAADHHRLIASKLEKVESGEIKRLMVFMPPRHGKSELCSRRFPAWFVGRNPSKQIICSTYGQDFANDFGREVRNIINEPEYKNVFDVGVRSDSSAANRWHTTENGVYVAAGAGGTITGRGAHVALIDDPFKNREDADSETIREKVWRWYSSTLRTRLMPGGAIVLIMTRWHEDDLAGRLLEQVKQGKGEEWDVLSLPAISDDGNPLWPEWYDLPELENIRKTLHARDWTALYQQQPQPDDGTYFKREKIKRYYLGEQPKNTHSYVSSDFAVTENGGDYTEFGVFEIDSQDDIYITDWWFGQKSSLTWIDSLIDVIDRSQPLMAFGESGQIRRAIEPFLSKRMTERNVYAAFEWITRTTDKPTMARAFQALVFAGKVHIPYTDWGERLLAQLLSFPSGKYDDGVDVCALFGLALGSVIGSTRPLPENDTNLVADYAHDDEDYYGDSNCPIV